MADLKELLARWLKFSESLDDEWWANGRNLDPETQTAEGQELAKLQELTSEVLKEEADGK